MENFKTIMSAQAVANRWLRIHTRSQKALYKVLGVAYAVYREAYERPHELEQAAARTGVKVRRDAPNRSATMVLKLIIMPEARHDLRSAFASWAKVLVWLHERDTDPAMAAREIGNQGGVAGVVKEVNAAKRSVCHSNRQDRKIKVSRIRRSLDGSRHGHVLKPGPVILVGRVTGDGNIVDVQVAGQEETAVREILTTLEKDTKIQSMKADPAAEPGEGDNDNGTPATSPQATKDALPPVVKVKFFSGSKAGLFGKHGSGQRNGEWYTPSWVLEPFYAAMGGQPFDLDPCSPTKGPAAPVWAKKHFTKDDDGLNQNWHGRVWLNPPYANLAEWVRKAADATWCSDMPNPPTEASGQREHPLCESVVALIPARTHTVYWQDYGTNHARVLFIHGKFGFWMPTPDGRLVQAKTRFPEGLAIVIWGHHRPFADALLDAELPCLGISDRSHQSLPDAPWEFYWQDRPHLGCSGQPGDAA